jgi:crotonobetainyl-CoA:carnitine CoA-transferase CaiB-like acyl-CoA transferase
VAGILAALHARQHTGRGQRVDVSLLGSQIWAQASEYTYHLATGDLPGRPNASHPLIPGIYGIVPTADGWLAVVGVVPPQRPAFYTAIGCPDLIEDARFASPLLSPAQKAELFDVLGEVFVTKATAEWCEILAAAGQRFAPVRTYADVVADPQVWANGYLAEVDGATTVGTPIRLSETPSRVGTAPPDVGADTMDVLLEVGYSDDEIAALVTDRVV